MNLTLDQALEMAAQFQNSGRSGEAESLYRQILQSLPDQADAANNLGNLLAAQGRMDEALEVLGRGAALNPGNAVLHYNRGNLLFHRNDLEEALAAYRRAGELAPDLAEAHYNAGVILQRLERDAEAEAAYRKVLALKGDDVPALVNLGIVLRRQGRVAEALASQDSALERAPDDIDALVGRGLALDDLGQNEEALASFRRALALNPDHREALTNLGSLLLRLLRVADAEPVFRRLTALAPEDNKVRFNLAHCLLLRGDFLSAYPFYEARWEVGKIDYRYPREQEWRGESLAGKTILLWVEQGLGDMLQMARYVPLVAQLGGRVVVECVPSMKRLFQASWVVAQATRLPLEQSAGEVACATCGEEVTVVAEGEGVPRFDYHCPFMSLPRVFGTTLETIPATVPYLSLPPGLKEQWAARLGPASVLRVGLVWATAQGGAEDDRQSKNIPPALFAPLARLEGVEFHSLQRGAVETMSFPLADHAAEIADFADTAALVANLDLVVTIDTAVAHLAGALGKPVWMLLKHGSGLFWMTEREDSPWYPTLRIFRQGAGEGWEGVLNRVTAELARAVEEKNAAAIKKSGAPPIN